jgi:transposase
MGLDLAKSIFQAHGVDATGQFVVRKSLRRSQMLRFFAKLPSCLVGIKACGTSHHWARELIKLSHEVRLALCSVVSFRTSFSSAHTAMLCRSAKTSH